MTNRRFVTYIVSIPVTLGLLLALVADASAADAPTPRHDAAGWAPAPGTAPGNPASTARAQMASWHVPGGCVVTTEVRSDGRIHRISRCEYSPALLARLASTGH